MRVHSRFLLNTPRIELWPAWLLRARASADARILARASRVLRRKRDGRYLAAVLGEGLMPLQPRLAREPGIDEALDLLDAPPRLSGALEPGGLPPTLLQARLDALGLDAEAYARRTGLATIA